MVKKFSLRKSLVGMTILIVFNIVHFVTHHFDRGDLPDVHNENRLISFPLS